MRGLFLMVFCDLRIAFRSLLRQRRRTLLLGLGLAAVTALLVILNALAAGVQHSMRRAATTLVTGHVNVAGYYKLKASQAAPVLLRPQPVIDLVEGAVPELDFLVQRGRDFGKVVSHKGSLDVEIDGIEIANEAHLRGALELRSGDLSGLRRPNTIVLFENQLEALDVRVGDAVTLSAQTALGAASAVDCEVVAIAKDLGLLSKWTVYVPLATFRALYQLHPEATGALQLHLRPEHLAAIPAVAQRLRAVLTGAGLAVMDPQPRALWDKLVGAGRESWIGQRLDVATWDDEVSLIKWMLEALRLLSVVLVLVLMAILIAGVTNSMWIAIRERTREIGTLRALGMQRWGVARHFLLESALLGIAGTVAGGALGALAAAALNALALPVPASVQHLLAFDRLLLVVSLRELAFAAFTLTAVTALAGLLPALRAARLRPVVAMSHFD